MHQMKLVFIFCGAHGSSQLGNKRTFINFCKRKKYYRIADVLKEITNIRQSYSKTDFKADKDEG